MGHRHPAAQGLILRQLTRRGAIYPVIALFIAVGALRVLAPGLPTDISAYVAAAETWSAGKDPYGIAIFDAPSWQGFPFVYLPVTLYFFVALCRLPRAALLFGDLVARFSLAYWSTRTLNRRLGRPALSDAEALFLLLLYEPFVTDLLAGNMAIYMLAAAAAVRRLTEVPRRPARLAGGIGLGLALMFKPSWGVPAAFFACQRRAWTVVAALAGGAAGAVALSIATGLIPSWLARVREASALYRSFDLGFLYPPLLGAAATAWVGIGVWLIRRSDDRARHAAWLWGCASLWAWPRLGSYSFLLLAPVLLWLGNRWGAKALLLCIPALGPLPWLIDEYAYQALLFCWSLAISGILLAKILRSPASPADTTHIDRPGLPEQE